MLIRLLIVGIRPIIFLMFMQRTAEKYILQGFTGGMNPWICPIWIPVCISWSWPLRNPGIAIASSFINFYYGTLGPGKQPRRPINILLGFSFEAEGPGDDADFEGVNRSCVRQKAVNHSPLNEVNGIGYIDLGGGGIYSQSIISSWRGSCIGTFDKKLRFRWWSNWVPVE